MLGCLVLNETYRYLRPPVDSAPAARPMRASHLQPTANSSNVSGRAVQALLMRYPHELREKMAWSKSYGHMLLQCATLLRLLHRNKQAGR